MSQIIDYFIGGFFLSIPSWIFMCVIYKLKINHNWKNMLLFIIVISMCYTITSACLPGTIKTIVNIACHAFMFRVLFDIYNAKAILLAILWSIILLVPDLISPLVFIKIFKMNKDYFMNELIGTPLANICMMMVVFLMTMLLKKTLIKVGDYKIEYNKQILIYTISTIICTILIFYTSLYNPQFDLNKIVNICIIGTFIVILITLIKQRNTNEKLTVAYDYLINYVKDYEEIIDNQRTYQHENRNQLITIKSKVIDNVKNKKIIKYIDSLLNEEADSDKEQYSKLTYLPSNGLKGLFYYKIAEAERSGIKVEVNISKSIKNSIISNLKIDDYKQLCRLIGVFVDNAIEASRDSYEKLCGLEIYEKNGDVYIIISNTYQNKDIIKFSIGSSTKGKGRGHGLKLAKNIVQTSPIFESTKEITDKLFIQAIKIKKTI